MKFNAVVGSVSISQVIFVPVNGLQKQGHRAQSKTYVFC